MSGWRNSRKKLACSTWKMRSVTSCSGSSSRLRTWERRTGKWEKFTLFLVSPSNTFKEHKSISPTKFCSMIPCKFPFAWQNYSCHSAPASSIQKWQLSGKHFTEPAEQYDHMYMSVLRLFLLLIAIGVHYLPGLSGGCTFAHQTNRI